MPPIAPPRRGYLFRRARGVYRAETASFSWGVDSSAAVIAQRGRELYLQDKG